MKFNKTFLATSFALLSSAASAGHFSTEITEENYNANLDYVVNVVNQFGGYCGGQLVAGKYVITAAHCLKQDPDGQFDLSLISSDPNDHTVATVDASKANMTVRVGNRNRHEAQEIEVVGIEISPDYIYEDSPNNINIKAIAIADGQNGETASFRGDLAILTLETSYKAKSAAIINTDTLTSEIDTNNPESIIKPEANIYGWGKTETGSSPAILRDTQMLYDVTTHWSTDDLSEISYLVHDSESFTKANTGAIADSGDSGSPIHIGGKVVAWVTGGTNRTSGTGSAYHTDWITAHINAVNSSQELEFNFEETTSESKSWNVPIQNLTNTAISFAPFISDSSGHFQITESNCEGLLNSGDDCTISVIFNESSIEISDSIESKLVLNDALEIPLIITKITPPQPDPVPDESNEESSGGGLSFGIIALLAIFVRRRV